MSKSILINKSCTHCGEECTIEEYTIDDHYFCCNGCLMVYELINHHGLHAYYKYEKNPGITLNGKEEESFDFLNDQATVSKLLVFQEGGTSKVKLHLPQIHCSSCLYLLENINRLDPGIIHSRVNFHAREASITFKDKETDLKSIVGLLSRIGYSAVLNYDQISGEKKVKTYDRQLLYKLGLAGFSFGNIMLLSFPEYLGFDKASYLFHIGYINLILAIPVLLYSGIDYLKSALKGIKYGSLNLDLPIAIGMITLFSRSVYEILSHSGEGYLDSFAGFIFFLLIGKWFQKVTYQSLDFERNYKSYFPISTTVKLGKNRITKPINELAPGDILMVKNQELIPADATLVTNKARIDYSFVTGESDLISKKQGDELYAGGKNQGGSIEIIVKKEVDQSYLTQLWNDDVFQKNRDSLSSRLIATVSKYFTFAILLISILTLSYWLLTTPEEAVKTFTAVLIVACPCALALSLPFTYGNILRLLSQNGLYLKNTSIIENVQEVDHIIFDKTGTITNSANIEINYLGASLNDDEKSMVKSACIHSSHPLSRAIVEIMPDVLIQDVELYKETIGLGLEAKGHVGSVKIGSSAFIFGSNPLKRERGVFIEINGTYKGVFKFEHGFRENIRSIIHGLKSQFNLSVLSGDVASGQEKIKELFDENHQIFFNQSPSDKLKHIKNLQAEGHKVMMIGDGLNDAGALKQSNVGIVISDNINNFSPACDGILDAQKFSSLFKLIYFLKRARYIIYGAFVLAFFYNTIGLYYAVTGQLSPVIAAILMPLSSITVIVYGVLVSYLFFRWSFKTERI